MSHTFTARRLSNADVGAVLADAGFGQVHCLTDDGTWLAARAG